MHQLVPYAHQFEEGTLATLYWNGRPVWPARNIGDLLGYANQGKRLPTLITREWAEEFIPDHDYVMPTGSELKTIQEVTSKGPYYAPFYSHRGLLLLFEPGLYLALLKTRKPAGKKLRRFIAQEVLPVLHRWTIHQDTGRVSESRSGGGLGLSDT